MKMTALMWTEQLKMSALSSPFVDAIPPLADAMALLLVTHHLCAAPWTFQNLEFIVSFFCNT